MSYNQRSFGAPSRHGPPCPSFRRFDSGGERSGKRQTGPVSGTTGVTERKVPPQAHVRRPGYASSSSSSGERYEEILLTANHYRIIIPDMTCYVYDIRIIPVRKNVTGHYIHIFNQDRNEEKKRLRKLLNEHNRTVMSKVVECHSQPGMLFHDPVTGTRINPVFDGFYNFYTAKPLPGLSRPPVAASVTQSTSTGMDWLGRPRNPSVSSSSSSITSPSFPGVSQREKFQKYLDIELDPGSVCTFEVNIHYSTSVDLNIINKYIRGIQSDSSPSKESISSLPLAELKAVDIILRHGPTVNRIPVAHALYSQDGESYPVAGHKDVIYGHFQSVRAKEAGATLNIDQISACFYTAGPILQVLARMDDAGEVGNPDFEPGRTTFDQFIDKVRSCKRNILVTQLRNAFSNLSVVTEHDKLPYKRKFKVKNVTTDSAEEKMFDLTQDLDSNGSSHHHHHTGKRISVADYYRSRYQIELKYPDLPCLQTGSEGRPVFFPLELVHIQPKQQTVNLTNKERKYIMTKSGEQTTEKRFSIIDRAAKTVISDSVDQLSEFSITMSDEPIRVKGNIVPHPMLDFGDRISHRPRAGKWDMKDKKLYRPAEGGIRDWMVVNLHMFHHSGTERRRLLNHFVRSLMQTGTSMGLEMSDPYCPDRGSGQSEADLFFDISHESDLLYPWKLQYVLNRHRLIPVEGNPTACHFPNLKAMIFIMEEKRDDHYNMIKMMCDIQFDLMSQVVFCSNVQQMDNLSHSTLMHNLILKMNTKLGGMNCLITDADRLRPIIDRYTMIMGADVTHPALSDSVTTSIACLTASCDREQYFYEVALRVQLSYKETITDMMDMSMQLLDQFYKRRQRMPSRIILFRDGVSEGQFDQVLVQEVAALRSACHQMRKEVGGELPTITVIIVRKRHHTRFTPVNSDQGVGKTHNVPAGTTVDTEVVSPKDFDFYMCSHEATVGTTRPTHYVVLVDENKLTPEQLFRITFNLCHLYPPTSKSISIPIPVQYAHLAAKRARSHAITHNGAGRLGKRKHPNELIRVAQQLNDAIRVRARTPDRPINMYYI